MKSKSWYNEIKNWWDGLKTWQQADVYRVVTIDTRPPPNMERRLTGAMQQLESLRTEYVKALTPGEGGLPEGFVREYQNLHGKVKSLEGELAAMKEKLAALEDQLEVIDPPVMEFKRPGGGYQRPPTTKEMAEWWDGASVLEREAAGARDLLNDNMINQYWDDLHAPTRSVLYYALANLEEEVGKWWDAVSLGEREIHGIKQHLEAKDLVSWWGDVTDAGKAHVLFFFETNPLPRYDKA